MNRRGFAIVTVVVILAVGLLFATMLVRRSLSQGPDNRAVHDRAQLRLLGLSVLEIAKLKIKTHPTELYRAFEFMSDVDPASRTTDLYDQYIAELNLEALDGRVTPGSRWNAMVTRIERLGITESGSGIGAGYVDDFFRITASATITTVGFGFERLTTDMQMNTTIRIKKRE